MVSVNSFLRLQCREPRGFRFSFFLLLSTLAKVSSINEGQPLDNFGNIKEVKVSFKCFSSVDSIDQTQSAALACYMLF